MSPEGMSVEEILKKPEKEILAHIRGTSTGSTQQEKEAMREMYVGALNVKLAQKTEILNRRILWLNVMLVFLTLILVVDALIRLNLLPFLCKKYLYKYSSF
jgi:hypothetical protein